MYLPTKPQKSLFTASLLTLNGAGGGSDLTSIFLEADGQNPRTQNQKRPHGLKATQYCSELHRIKQKKCWNKGALVFSILTTWYFDSLAQGGHLLQGFDMGWNSCFQARVLFAYPLFGGFYGFRTCKNTISAFRKMTVSLKSQNLSWKNGEHLTKISTKLTLYIVVFRRHEVTIFHSVIYRSIAYL